MPDAEEPTEAAWVSVGEQIDRLRQPEPDAREVETACRVMHDAYEAAAVEHGWETQERSRVAWEDVPEANKATMRAAVGALLAAGYVPPEEHARAVRLAEWRGAERAIRKGRAAQRTESTIIMCETPTGCTCGAPASTPAGMHHRDCAIRSTEEES